MERARSHAAAAVSVVGAVLVFTPIVALVLTPVVLPVAIVAGAALLWRGRAATSAIV